MGEKGAKLDTSCLEERPHRRGDMTKEDPTGSSLPIETPQQPEPVNAQS